VNISFVAFMFAVKPKTLHHWYKSQLSGYKQSVKAGTWGDKSIKILDEQTGEILKQKAVPIAKPENMGSHMAIDEKQVGKKMYTLITNIETGKIAFMAQSIKSSEIGQAIHEYLGGTLGAVKSMSCDMAASFIKLSKEVFLNANLVIDKFHVIKHLMDALQQVRRELKTECLNKETNVPKKAGGVNKSEEERMWTDAEMLERSRYVLVKSEIEWENEEKEMIGDLFKKYPVLKTAYSLTQDLRKWYDKSNVGRRKQEMEKEFDDWCAAVNKSGINPFKAVRKMMEKHLGDILNYFLEGKTSAKAENMNGKIQRFLANNFGIIDRDFFLYRVAGYFS